MPAFPGMGGIPNFTGGQQEPVGLDVMTSMLGINLPSMPERDDMGLYGINDTQRQNAGNKGLAQALFGASQSFLGGGPQPALQGGMNAGLVRDEYLKEASMRNIQDYEMQVKNTLAQLEVLGKKSNLELSQIQAEDARMRLESAKRQQGIAKVAMQELTPVAQAQIAEAERRVGPTYATQLKVKFASIQQLSEAGDLEKADAELGEIFNEFARLDPTGEWAAKAEQDAQAAIVTGMAKHKVDTTIIQEYMKSSGMEGYTWEFNANGSPSLVTPYTNQLRQAQLANVQSMAAENQAQAARQRHLAEASAGLTPAGAAKMATEVRNAIAFLQTKPPVLNAKRPEWEEKFAKAQMALLSANLDPDFSKPENLKAALAWTSQGLPGQISSITKRTSESLAPLLGGEGGGDAQQSSGSGNWSVPKTRALLNEAVRSATTDEDAAIALADLAKISDPKLHAAMANSAGETPLQKLKNLSKNYKP